MPIWIIVLIICIGVSVWLYNYLARNSGNASPSSNVTVAGIVGAVLFIILLSFLKLVLNL